MASSPRASSADVASLSRQPSAARTNTSVNAVRPSTRSTSRQPHLRPLHAADDRRFVELFHRQRFEPELFDLKLAGLDRGDERLLAEPVAELVDLDEVRHEHGFERTPVARANRIHDLVAELLEFLHHVPSVLPRRGGTPPATTAKVYARAGRKA